MNSKSITGIAILMFIFFIGCSGNNASIKNQAQDKSKITQLELFETNTSITCPNGTLLVLLEAQPSIIWFGNHSRKGGKTNDQIQHFLSK